MWVLALLLLGRAVSVLAQGAPVHASSGGSTTIGLDPFKKVKAFQKIRHPNDIIANLNGMMKPTRIGKKNTCSIFFLETVSKSSTEILMKHNLCGHLGISDVIVKVKKVLSFA